ncbi:MAG: 50S ribosomal protein L11 methyltransferase [Phycisphaeraceae bacterium]
MNADWQTIESRVMDPPLQMAICREAFRPNPTTVRFARAVEVSPGETVFDIGSGIGPLAIKAAMSGAGRVVAVDPVACHCELARANVARYDLADRVSVYQGRFFEPFETQPELQGLKAQVIIGDVSGIADGVARALGWYGSDVPTGGGDGAEVLVEMLDRARDYLAPGGRVYFPIAVDLSNAARVEEAAKRYYSEIENALARPYVIFPLTPEEISAIHAAYDGELPPYINIQTHPRPCWRGQILVARGPR